MTSTPFILLVTLSLGATAEAQRKETSPRPAVSRFVRSSSDTISLPQGIAQPKLSATLRFLIPGSIVEIPVIEGEAVSTGAPLVALDARLSRARLRLAEVSANRTGERQHAEIQLRFGQKQLSRLEQLYARSAVSELEVEEQRALVERSQAVYTTQLEVLEMAEGNRDLAKEQLRHMTIFAPFDGVVTQIHQRLGASVTADSAVVSVANLKTLQVELYAPVHLFGTMKRGDVVFLLAREPVNDDIQATVSSTSPIINSASATFRCVLEIDNTDERLPAGFAVSLK